MRSDAAAQCILQFALYRYDFTRYGGNKLILLCVRIRTGICSDVDKQMTRDGGMLIKISTADNNYLCTVFIRILMLCGYVLNE